MEHCVDEANVFHAEAAEELGEAAHLVGVCFEIPHFLQNAGFAAGFEVDAGECGEGVSEGETLLDELFDFAAQSAVHTDANKAFELFTNQQLFVECGFHLVTISYVTKGIVIFKKIYTVWRACAQIIFSIAAAFGNRETNCRIPFAENLTLDCAFHVHKSFSLNMLFVFDRQFARSNVGTWIRFNSTHPAAI